MIKELKKWMPMFWDDYLRGTQEFTNATEHGAYLLLIAYCWDKGALPKDDDARRRIAKCTHRQWALVSRRVVTKFDSEGRNKRCDEELAYAIEKSKRMSANAKLRYSNSNAKADTPTPTPTKKERERGPTKEKVAAKADRKRGPRAPMPDDWRPSEVGEQYAAAAGFAKERVERMVRKCRDYHIRNSTMIAGERGLAATWRTWVDHEVDFDREKNGTPVDLEPDYKQLTKGMTPEEKKAFAQEEMRKFREANSVG